MQVAPDPTSVIGKTPAVWLNRVTREAKAVVAAHRTAVVRTIVDGDV